jgi:nucleotide-binding universal stress UspA family protein
MAATSRVVRDDDVDIEGASATDDARVSFRRVLVPLDGSPLAAHALPTAWALAERLGATVHTVSVASNDNEADRMREHAEAALRGPDVRDRVHVVVGGEPADGIEQWRRELGSTVLCMATHGRGRAVGSLIGSAARSVLEQSVDPIVAVGPFAEAPPEFVSRKSPAPRRPPLSVPRLVACVDGSEVSEAVLPVAAAWSRTLEMALTILTVADPALPPLDRGDPWKRRYGPNGNVDSYVADLAAQWQRGDRDVEGEVVYDPISPSSGVKSSLDEHPAGLLAVTTHARQGWRRLRFGAGAAGIVRASSVPTLVVPLSD